MWHNILQNCGGHLRTMLKGVGCVRLPFLYHFTIEETLRMKVVTSSVNKYKCLM